MSEDGMKKRCKTLIATTRVHRALCVKHDRPKLVAQDDMKLRMLNCILYGKH